MQQRLVLCRSALAVTAASGSTLLRPSAEISPIQ
jgi:hypothetical protein